MMEMEKQRLLIISNNVLSTTRNNGKTILSYFDCLPQEQVYQLYFSPERPKINGYRYFQLSDRDVLRGWVMSSRRGRALECEKNSEEKKNEQSTNQNSTAVPRSPLFRMMRELLWCGHWKSCQLLNWLDAVKPTAVFFVGGDCGFAYDICRFIVKRYQAKLTLYITDDYVIPYAEDQALIRMRKGFLRNKIRKCLKNTACFYTVSQPMQRAYEELFGRSSDLAVNMPESLRCPSMNCDNEQLTLLYAGSLYYGRAEVLGKIVDALRNFNESTDGKKAVLHVYTNQMPDEGVRKMIEKDGAGKCCGSLNQEELKRALNQADILVFAESFDPEHIRKTKFSLSTKIPEYLSVGKPILAVGPKGIGSMDYLEDAAFCIQDESKIMDVSKLLFSHEMQQELALNSIQKYEKCHNKENLQQKIIRSIL